MPEFIKVIKILIFAIFVTFVLQYKYKNLSLEKHIYSWTQSSKSALYIREVSIGGALVIKKAIEEINKIATQPAKKSDKNKE